MELILMALFFISIPIIHVFYVRNKNKSKSLPPLKDKQKTAYILTIVGVAFSAIVSLIPALFVFLLAADPSREPYGIGLLGAFLLPLSIFGVIMTIILYLYLKPNVFRYIPRFVNIILLIAAYIYLSITYFVDDLILSTTSKKNVEGILNTLNNDEQPSLLPKLLYIGPILIVIGAIMGLVLHRKQIKTTENPDSPSG